MVEGHRGDTQHLREEANQVAEDQMLPALHFESLMGASSKDAIVPRPI